MKNATARKTKLSDIDQRWIAKCKRERKAWMKLFECDAADDVIMALDDLIAWGEKSVARAKKAKGGR